MLGKGMTVSEATHRWVQEFNRFPQDMISKLMSIDIDGWHEVTMPGGECMYSICPMAARTMKILVRLRISWQKQMCTLSILMMATLLRSGRAISS